MRRRQKRKEREINDVKKKERKKRLECNLALYTFGRVFLISNLWAFHSLRI